MYDDYEGEHAAEPPPHALQEAAGPDANTLRIMISTDVHAGYAEDDDIRGEDSLRTFEEVMAAASRYKCDMVLLGGDLFHANKPKLNILGRVMGVLKRYSFNRRDPTITVENQCFSLFQDGKVNCSGRDVRAGMPVFSIHGNHDDPTGVDYVSVMDVLHQGSLVNYFGKHRTEDAITVKPLLIRKGTASLALYGLGNLSDETLTSTIGRGRLQWDVPPMDGKGWYTMAVVHQNRYPRGRVPYLRAKDIPDHIRAVIWGHEHECRVAFEGCGVPGKDLVISQPGSTVATSLAPGESVKKHALIIEVAKDDDCGDDEKDHRNDGSNRVGDARMKVRQNCFRLHTVRPFIHRDLDLKAAEELEGRPPSTVSAEELTRLFAREVQHMIKQAIEEDKGNIPPSLPLSDARIASSPTLRLNLRKPLVRLRIRNNAGYVRLNATAFGAAFESQVANPESILLYEKVDNRNRLSRDIAMGGGGTAALDNAGDEIVLEHVRRHLVRARLSSIGHGGVLDALHSFVHSDNNQAFHEFLTKSINDLVANTSISVEKCSDESAVREAIGLRMKRIREQDEKRMAALGLSLDKGANLTVGTKPKAAGHGMAKQVNESKESKPDGKLKTESPGSRTQGMMGDDDDDGDLLASPLRALEDDKLVLAGPGDDEAVLVSQSRSGNRGTTGRIGILKTEPTSPAKRGRKPAGRRGNGSATRSRARDESEGAGVVLDLCNEDDDDELTVLSSLGRKGNARPRGQAIKQEIKPRQSANSPILITDVRDEGDRDPMVGTKRPRPRQGHGQGHLHSHRTPHPSNCCGGADEGEFDIELPQDDADNSQRAKRIRLYARSGCGHDPNDQTGGYTKEEADQMVRMMQSGIDTEERDQGHVDGNIGNGDERPDQKRRRKKQAADDYIELG